MLYVGTGVKAGVSAAVRVDVGVTAELGAGVPAPVGVCVMAATELLLRFPYPEPAQEKCEKWSGKIKKLIEIIV